MMSLNRMNLSWKRNRLVIGPAIVVAIGACGCLDAGPDSDRVTIHNRLSIDLPAGSSHRVDEGIDSLVGVITLGGTQCTLQYDIGAFAGNYATYEGNGPFAWRNRETIDGIAMDSALSVEDGHQTLYVSFPDFGPANFWTEIHDPSEVDTILHAMRTLRPIEQG